MMERFFILIGGLALLIVNFFNDLSLPEIDFERQSKNREIDTSIFSKLNLNQEIQPIKEKNTRMDEIRDEIIPYLMNKVTVLAVCMVLILLVAFTNLEIAGIFLVVVFMIYFFIIYYPKIKEQRSYEDINQELPYALRHMGIELKSGKGLHEALSTIRDADYGSLSREFNRVLEEVKFGASTEDSLLKMSHRVKSEGLSRAIQQIIGTLRVGGNLSNSLEVIAKDITFEMQIKLKEYSQKLNSFILIYTFIAILAPVISLIMLMAASTVMGDIISVNLLFLIYVAFFPMIVMFMGIFIKKLEPKI
jgi:flagellar protein FlaJ